MKCGFCNTINRIALKCSSRCGHPQPYFADRCRLINRSRSGWIFVRDIPVEPGHAELTSVFGSDKNAIGVEIALPDRSGFIVAPVPALPPEQVGFADTVLRSRNAGPRHQPDSERGNLRSSRPLMRFIEALYKHWCVDPS